MESSAGSFYVDANGRGYWSQSKNEQLSGPSVEASEAKASQPASQKSKSTKGASKVAESPSAQEGMDHALTSIETTEAFLKANGVAFKTVRHEQTMTNAEMHGAIKFEGEHAGAALAKQLFLHDKKNKERMFLVCAEVDQEVDLKALSKQLGVGSGNLRGADADALYKYLGCRKGMVNYLAIVNDVEKKVKVLYDKKLYDSKWQSFHPMDNTASTCINADGVNKVKELAGRDDSTFEIVDFAALAGGEATTAGAKDPAPQQKKGKEKRKDQAKPE